MSRMPDKWLSLLKEIDPHIENSLERTLGIIKTQREQGIVVYPAEGDVFKAFELCSPESAKVWIQGQDPYPGVFKEQDGELTPFATGTAFSVHQRARIPASLKNIFKELGNDLGKEPPKHGDLAYWAEQGVLLVNAALSVQHGVPDSHGKIGWAHLVQTACLAISKRKPMAFVLWGKKAQAIEEFISKDHQHLVLKSAHPSPMGGACKQFFGTKPFSQVNEYLLKIGQSPVVW